MVSSLGKNHLTVAASFLAQRAGNQIVKLGSLHHLCFLDRMASEKPKMVKMKNMGRGNREQEERGGITEEREGKRMRLWETKEDDGYHRR
ncbi:hypothetical protein L6452_00570 [Arctium lappa]|uniref:Uncharacterized protein n=1 Tax=Arctium lappa TaxID=4217 RepID=A0ACB9FFQ9_ARCLA|nr:hypothetical protein L6452_00570 [Arctium lappa]